MADKDVKKPKAKAVHTDPATSATPEQEPLPPAVTKRSPEQKSPAEWAYQRLVLYIQNFEKQLEPQHEVAIGLTGSEAGVIRIEGIGFFDPDMITFYGYDPTGARTQLIQHVSQLNVALRALPKPTGETEARRIGFRLAQSLDEDE